MDTILAWCAEHRPDVLCLQETKVQDHEFPRAPIEASGYHVAFCGMKSYNGVAILSRAPAQAVTFGMPDDPFRLARATIGGVTFVNTYVPQGRDLEHAMFAYKLKWYARLRDYFDAHFKPEDSVVWLGDCNVAAESIDVHNPEQQEEHVCYHESARRAFAHCRAWGFVDLFRQFHPEAGHYSFFDYRTNFGVSRPAGWRIDYILASPHLAKRAQDAWIDVKPRLGNRPSDHTFVVADFDLSAPAPR
jgi:exodeoxyribonuclease-3